MARWILYLMVTTACLFTAGNAEGRGFSKTLNKGWNLMAIPNSPETAGINYASDLVNKIGSGSQAVTVANEGKFMLYVPDIRAAKSLAPVLATTATTNSTNFAITKDGSTGYLVFTPSARTIIFSSSLTTTALLFAHTLSSGQTEVVTESMTNGTITTIGRFTLPAGASNLALDPLERYAVYSVQITAGCSETGLERIDLKSGAKLRLTSPTCSSGVRFHDPVWDRDGSRIIVARDIPGQPTDLIGVSADGSTTSVVLAGTDARYNARRFLSPTGSGQVVMFSNDHPKDTFYLFPRLVEATLGGTSATVTVLVSNPVDVQGVDADADQTTFTAGATFGRPQLFRLKSGALTQLTQNDWDIRFPLVNRDGGTSILYLSTNGVTSLNWYKLDNYGTTQVSNLAGAGVDASTIQAPQIITLK